MVPAAHACGATAAGGGGGGVGDSRGDSHPRSGFSHPSPTETPSRGGVGEGGRGAGPPEAFSPPFFLERSQEGRRGCPYPATRAGGIAGWLPKRGRGEATVLGKLRQCWPGASSQHTFGSSSPPHWDQPPNFNSTPQPVRSVFPLQK